MLLLHQIGSVKVGEVVRYTLTYTPSRDRILPTPTHLHVRIKNASPIPLRAAFVHGPYSLHVSAYPSTFNPHEKGDPDQGAPEYEPLLKAGAHWSCKIKIPDTIRETGESSPITSASPSDHHANPKSAAWIIEVASQILFSSTASVHYELLVGRDDRSLALGFAAAAAHGHSGPGRVQDHKQGARRASGLAKGIYSKAVKLIVQDTEDLWDTPKLPSTEGRTNETKLGDVSDEDKGTATTASKQPPNKAKQKVHLVILSHGVHSNLSADMLYLKESIDATVRQAKDERRKRRSAAPPGSQHGSRASGSDPPSPSASDNQPTSTAPLSGGQDQDNDPSEYDSDEELTIVRGFTGNAIKTEKGIQYLGKRLAKYILHFTHPDQPYVPMKKPGSFSNLFSIGNSNGNNSSSDAQSCDKDGNTATKPCAPSVHAGSHIHKAGSGPTRELPYTFTSISFIGHSLGGLIQTYAIAYIQKHAPEFFQQIRPVNFICLASPLLGLSNENPMYVKFALDFGLVGRTGQDLGLTWRAPTLAKSGWSAIVSGLTPGSKENSQQNPGSKPLLRILPTGPAHQVLRMFRNRTVYSNVVNDGIVPLRTSCLLFLDWKGLGKVDKARRENGLIGTVAEWGWAELTGATADAPGFPYRLRPNQPGSGHSSSAHISSDTVPQPAEDSTELDNKNSNVPEPVRDHSLKAPRDNDNNLISPTPSAQSTNSHTSSMFDTVVGFFKPSGVERGPKSMRAIRRGQTLGQEIDPTVVTDSSMKDLGTPLQESPPATPHNSRPAATRGDSVEQSLLSGPPKTSIFEAAGDILHPPLPSRAWITDPESRQRTIFHDRVYHPEDIPPPPMRSIRTGRSFSSDAAAPQTKPAIRPSSDSKADPGQEIDLSRMKIEERIARAYHRDLSWRKVLVSLEPDAHNNMIVRRMFANAYGWPVVKHLCDTHFADTWSAATRDEHEPAVDRAHDTVMTGVEVKRGDEVVNQRSRSAPRRKSGDMRRAGDELADDPAAPEHETSEPSLRVPPVEQAAHPQSPYIEHDSEVWDDAYFEGTEDEEEDEGIKGAISKVLAPTAAGVGAFVQSLSSPTDGHRGLGPLSTASAQEHVKETVGRAAAGVATGKLQKPVAVDPPDEQVTPIAAVFSPDGLTAEPMDVDPKS